jgi:CRP/FNR family cyclic AMP-dependent transcriptional regulator
MPLLPMPQLHFERWNRYNPRRARPSELREAPVGKSAKEFDPKAFLARVGAAETILKIKRTEHVFEQGDMAGTVFTFKRAGSSSLSYPSK